MFAVTTPTFEIPSNIRIMAVAPPSAVMGVSYAAAGEAASCSSSERRRW